MLKINTHSFVTNSFKLTIGTLITKSIPFLILPILVSCLTVLEFGILATITVINSVFINIISFSTPSFLNLSYIKNNKKEFKENLSSSLFIISTYFLLLIILNIFFGEYLEKYLKISHSFVFLILLSAFFTSTAEIALAIFKAKKDANSFLKLELIRTIFNIFISSLLIMVLKFGWQGRLFGIVSGSSLAFLISVIYFFKKQYITNITKKSLKRIVDFGSPLIPYVLSGWIITASDRLFINHYLGVQVNGEYSFAYQIATIITVLGLSINYAWQPFLYESLRNNKPIFKVLSSVTLILISISIFIYLSFPLLIKLITSGGYDNSSELIPILLISSLLYCMEMYLISFFFYYGKNIYLLPLTILASSSNIYFNYLLIPSIGAMGAAYSTLISYILSFTLTLCIFYFKIYKEQSYFRAEPLKK